MMLDLSDANEIQRSQLQAVISHFLPLPSILYLSTVKDLFPSQIGVPTCAAAVSSIPATFVLRYFILPLPPDALGLGSNVGLDLVL